MHRAGDRVGAYALLREIKRSPDACLWLADRADGKARGPDAVAIRLTQSPEACVRLEREYQRLVAVGIPSAPATVGFVSGHDNGSGALSTEWIPGLDLIEVLRARDQGAVTVDIGAALELVLRLVRGITPLHTREVRLVHGAIWADQIRFDAHGQMRLTGWGNWNPPGASDWEAPELREGAPSTAALDAWGLGRVALQLLVSPRRAGLARVDRLALLTKANPPVARWVGVCSRKIRRADLPSTASSSEMSWRCNASWAASRMSSVCSTIRVIGWLSAGWMRDLQTPWICFGRPYPVAPHGWGMSKRPLLRFRCSR